MYNEMSFITDNYYVQHTVRKMKVNELFGIIGGAILFIFFGLGCFPKSFNEYRMRYLVGSQLYEIRPSHTTSKYSFGKRSKGKLKKIKTE